MKSDCIKLSSQEEIMQRRLAIQRIKENNQEKLLESKDALKETKCSPQKHKPQPQAEKQRNRIQSTYVYSEIPQFNKNPGVGDTDKMIFDKKFKNYLNHKQMYLLKAQKKRQRMLQRRRKQKQGIEDEDYFNEEEVLSDRGSDYEYQDASDMMAAFDQMVTGKKRKGKGFQLFHCQKYENIFRRHQFEMLLAVTESEQNLEKQLITKNEFLNYLFDQFIVMMLYSINPYQIGDQLAEFETKVIEKLDYEEFSRFLLTDRQPTYFEYSKEVIQQARKLGRGIKCAPIIAKWVDQTGIFQFLIDIFKSLDMHGDGMVQRKFLANKIRKQAEERRLSEVQVIEIVNINKLIPLNRIIYEIQHDGSPDPDISFDQFQQFLVDYKRLETPPKDLLITQLILKGKFDPSYVYIISTQVLEIIKDVFQNKTPKFAEYFVVKEKFLEKLCQDSRYKRVKDFYVRSQGNKYVQKENVEETLARIYAEGDFYLDIEEILQFFTNRGRPKLIEYKVYIANLERQIALIQEEEKLKKQKYGGDDLQSTSSDEQYSKLVKQRRIKRKRDKLAQIRMSNNFTAQKKFNVTIPQAFQFDIKGKNKKPSIRQMKVKKMLQQKRLKQQEARKPVPVKEVPDYVKQNLYERLMRDQQRERQQRLEKFRMEILNNFKVSDRLMQPKSQQIHCDFSMKQYKFVARPMPWYCEVNLIERIDRKKQQRRQRILEQLINRNSEFDVPEGVQKMIQRQQLLAQKRKETRTNSTGTLNECTFMPRISQRVPDFPTIHQHLHFDLENAKNIKEPIHIEPFSFENRPSKSKTTYQDKKKDDQKQKMRLSKHDCLEGQQNYMNIPKTQKFDALVQLRRKQEEVRQKKFQEQKKQSVIRKLRQQKFAPIVRKALKQNQKDLSKSRGVIAERIKVFRKEERKKKHDYENEMIKIYTKVFQRPLLIENGGVQNGDLKHSKNQKEEQYLNYYYQQPKQKNTRKNVPKIKAELEPKHFMEMDQERRKAVQDHEPGQYPSDYEGDEQDEPYQQDEGEGYDQDYHSDNGGHYTS